MELHPVQFDLLVLAFMLLLAGTVRGALFVTKRVRGPELDFYLSLEALSDFLRELIGVDEVSKDSKFKIKRKLCDARHLAFITTSVILSISIPLCVPVATLSVDRVGKGVSTPSPRSIVAWSPNGTRIQPVDFSKCLGAKATWIRNYANPSKIVWRCAGSGYELSIAQLKAHPEVTASSKSLSSDEQRVASMHCKRCNLSIRMKSFTWTPEVPTCGVPTQAATFELHAGFQDKKHANMSDCQLKNETLLVTGERFKQMMKKHGGICHSAVVSINSTSSQVSGHLTAFHMLHTRHDLNKSVILYQIADNDVHEDLKLLELGLVHRSLAAMTRKVGKRAELTKQEFELTRSLDEEISGRKLSRDIVVLDNGFLIVVTLIFMIAFIALKSIELAFLASDSDRSRYLRTLVGHHMQERNWLSSYELREVRNAYRQ